MINRSQLLTLINNAFPDNDNQEITASVMRSFQTELANSNLNLISDNQILGLGGWTNKAYTLGQSVVYNNFIYQAQVSVTTSGSFVPGEWSPISTYINSTAGLADYQKIGNTISLDDNKIIPTHPTDTDFRANLTGFYKVESVTVPVGLNEIYPIAGKALISVFKRTTQAESLIFFYPLSDLTKYYVRKVNSNWTEFNSAIDYTFTDGLTIADSTVTLGGFFDVTTLQGSDADTSTFSITDAKQIDLEAEKVNITGDVYLPDATIQPVDSNTKILAIDEASKKTYEINISDIASAGAGFRLAELSDVQINNLSNKDILFNNAGTWGNAKPANGITINNNVLSLGGLLSDNVFIDSDESDYKNIVIGANKPTGWFEVYALGDIWFQYHNPDLGGTEFFAQIILDNAGVSISTNPGFGYSANLRTDLITSPGRVFQFPNVAGTIALTSDLITASTSGNYYLPKSGGEILGDLKMNVSRIYSDSNENPIVTEFLPTNGIGSYGPPWNNLRTYIIGSGTYSDPENCSLFCQSPSSLTLFARSPEHYSKIDLYASGDGIGLNTDNGYSAYLKTTIITESRTFEFPNQSGTFALTSDIVSAVYASTSGNYLPKGGGVMTGDIVMQNYNQIRNINVPGNYIQVSGASGGVAIASADTIEIGAQNVNISSFNNVTSSAANGDAVAMQSVGTSLFETFGHTLVTTTDFSAYSVITTDLETIKMSVMLDNDLYKKEIAITKDDIKFNGENGELLTITNESFIVAGNKAITVPIGDTSERPGTPTDGMIRYNTQTAKYEGYITGTGWVDFH